MSGVDEVCCGYVERTLWHFHGDEPLDGFATPAGLFKIVRSEQIV